MVFRNEVLELIQYKPTVDQVYTRPLVISPPQVNKFYCAGPFAGEEPGQVRGRPGLQLFAISWRNPTKAQRDWNLSTYVQALDEAVDAARQITGSPDVNLWGACSGGMTAAAYLGWLAATGQTQGGQRDLAGVRARPVEDDGHDDGPDGRRQELQGGQGGASSARASSTGPRWRASSPGCGRTT